MNTTTNQNDDHFAKIITPLMNKVPEITIFFWVIKILCTTIGETASDFLNETLGLGLTITGIVMAVVLIIALVYQFRSKKYTPSKYWLSVVLISVVGTLITDNLSDNLGVSLKISTAVFAVILAIVFAVWYAQEKTLSIHSINTFKREAFYWLAILFTFALGTTAGDLIAEQFNIGYFPSLAIFAAAIAIIYWLYKQFNLNATLAFWAAYILTRPLGASLGDFLTQARSDGGLGLGTVATTAIFLVAIIVTVVYLIKTKKDVIQTEQ
ncbi:MAG TPA: hypothetical protein VL576_02250 [Candidatus Paceibacterota bacterium]|jgi:uncharacterized membrane-anchored protein|nr:hypothetical protein [Candidatus Paceibacterota bacterium]